MTPGTRRYSGALANGSASDGSAVINSNSSGSSDPYRLSRCSTWVRVNPVSATSSGRAFHIA